MKTIVLAFSLIALAATSHAAPKSNVDGAALAKKCHEIVGKEQPEGEGRGNVGHFQAQRFSNCMMGEPH
jgi:hypothetical protein